MFKMSRRRAHSVQPLTKETADPTAATAAASAFMRGNPTAQSSLSSAAAAAALRAQPSPPTNVAGVSSKRVQRRASSLSAGRDRGKGTLQRSPSVGSMSERTFRSPSPGGRAPLGRQDVPPVPSIPATRTAASPLRTQNFQTASQKTAAHQQQGAWFGPATQHAYQGKKMERAAEVTPELPDSRSGSVNSSINFSYPRPRMTSYDSHTASEPDLVYDPNSRRMVPRVSLVQASQQIEDTPVTSTEKAKGPKPVKQRHVPQEATNEGRPKSPDSFQPQHSSTITGQNHTPDASLGRRSPIASPSFNTPMPAPATETLPQERGFEAENSSNWQNQNQNASFSETPVALAESNLKPGSPKWDNAKAEPPFSYAGSGSSEASVRSAHFASSTDQLVVKHEPPPRSLSPRKSALKSAITGKGSHNETSESSAFGTSHHLKEDLSPTHRKGARVSWNDNGTVVVAEPGKLDEADPAAVHNLQSRQKTQSTFEGSRGTKASLLQQDELMSPRPALPLFGSIRDKKGKEPEERQLVRPRERSLSPHSQQASSSHTVSFNSENDMPAPVDSVKPVHHGRGQASRNVANISKFREPLPAIIASTESLGQESEELLSSGDELFEDVPTSTEQARSRKSATALSSESKPLSDSSPSDPSQVASKTVDGSLGGSIPDTHAPVADQNDVSVVETSPLPGSFPLDDDVSGVLMDSTSNFPTSGVAQASGHDAGNRDRPEKDDRGEDESDMDSIYSDAFEDLSEAGDDGFMSLDAALVSSTVASAGGKETSFSSSHTAKTLDGVVAAPFQSSDDWERTKAYWKSLSTEERRRLELEALMETDDDAIRERSPKEAKSLGDISEHPLTSAQRSQLRRQLQREQLSGAGPASLGGTTQTSAVIPTPATSSTVSRSGIPADGHRSQAKKGTAKMRGEEQPLNQTDFAVTDAQRGHGFAQQPSTPPRSGMAMGRRLQKLSQPKRSVSIDQRHVDDEARGSVARPRSLADLRQRRREEPTQSPIIEPATTTIARSTLRRRGSDSSESSFVRSRSVGSPRLGFRASMRSSSFESKSSLPGPAGRKRLTLRSLSPTTSHTKRSSVTSAAPSRSLFESQTHRSARHSSVEPYHSRFSSRKEENPTYGGRFSDSSDDEFMHTPPPTDGSILGDEHQPAHSRLMHSFLHKYARNSPPDLSSSASAGFTSRRDADRLRGDRFQDDGNAHLPLDQQSGQGSKARAASTSSRRQGLISTLRRRRTNDADGGHNVILQHHEQDTRAAGWPLQNTTGEARAASMTSSEGDTARRSAANGALVTNDLTSEPRQPHELPHYGGGSDANHANPLSQEPKRKKFNGLRKMFKINN